MSIVLPPPIALYFEIEHTLATGRLADLLTPDALVHDESHEHRGVPAIAAWMADAKAKYDQTTVPKALVERDGRTVVTADVSGTFPGSPVTLDFAFRLHGDRIAELEIH